MKRLVVLALAVGLILTVGPVHAQGDYLSAEQMYFAPDSLVPDYYPRVELPNLSLVDSFVWAAGGDSVVDADILPVLQPGEYGAGYAYSPSDYYLTPTVDYQADLTGGTLTASFETPGLYHVRVTRQSGLSDVFAVFAETYLKGDEGKPDKTGPEKKLEDTVPGTQGVDLILVEQRDTAMDDSAATWGKYGLGDKVQRITSRQDAIKKIKEAFKGKKLHVELDGHGYGGYISMGGGWKKGADYYMDKDTAQEFANAIKEYVSNLTFQGCSVAEGTAGQEFLNLFRKTLGQSGAWDSPVTVHDKSHFSVPPNANFIPEPGSLALLICGLLVGSARRLRRAA